ncbi:unnamed protein product [Cyclocybe aegerita]|uniref:Uncharacterized protein n=1 Tax=Cyclocybe aegerita TaxID=1973307 RepID=A0A8S0W524_CYCAE|nr:unnamed protein product [Cyclocybe aegerita]
MQYKRIRVTTVSRERPKTAYARKIKLEYPSMPVDVGGFTAYGGGHNQCYLGQATIDIPLPSSRESSINDIPHPTGASFDSSPSINSVTSLIHYTSYVCLSPPPRYLPRFAVPAICYF